MPVNTAAKTLKRSNPTGKRALHSAPFRFRMKLTLSLMLYDVFSRSGGLTGLFSGFFVVIVGVGISRGSWSPVTYARFLFICLASIFKKDAKSIGRRRWMMFPRPLGSRDSKHMWIECWSRDMHCPLSNSCLCEMTIDGMLWRLMNFLAIVVVRREARSSLSEQ